MNKRKMPCGKDYWAVREKGSIADENEKLYTCKTCEVENCKICDDYFKRKEVKNEKTKSG